MLSVRILISFFKRNPFQNIIGIFLFFLALNCFAVNEVPKDSPTSPRTSSNPVSSQSDFEPLVEYYTDKNSNGEIIIYGGFHVIDTHFDHPNELDISIGKYKKHVSEKEIETYNKFTQRRFSYFEYNRLSEEGFYFSLKRQFGLFSLIIHDPNPLQKNDFNIPILVTIKANNLVASGNVTFKVLDNNFRNSQFHVDPSLDALKTVHMPKIFYQIYKTENSSVNTDFEAKIYSIVPSKGTNELIFSDLETPIIIGYRCGGGGASGGIIATANGRFFAIGIERNYSNIHTHRDCPKHQQIYELYVDGTNKVKKVADIYSGETSVSEFFLSPNADRVGYFETEGKSESKIIVIHDTNSGKIVKKIPLDKYKEKESYFTQAGWLPDGNRIFFNQIPEGESDAHPKDGGYILDLTTDKIEKINIVPNSESIKTSNAENYNDTLPQILDGLQNGDLLVADQGGLKGLNLQTNKRYKYFSDSEGSGCIRVPPYENKISSCFNGSIIVENEKGKKILINIDTKDPYNVIRPLVGIGQRF